MTHRPSPISVEINANCFLMEGMRGMLDVRLGNTVTDEPFVVELSLHSRILPAPVTRHVQLRQGGQAMRSMPLEIAQSKEPRLSSAGQALIKVGLVIDAGEDGKHRFTGEFVVTVLAYMQSR